MSHIGEAIRRTRRDHGMTLAQVAREAGISQGYLSKIEGGRNVPRVATLLKISNVFPDEDSAFWLYLLLTDLWGQPVVDVMREWAVKMAARP